MKHIFLFIAVFTLFNCKPEKEEPKPLTAPVLTTMEAGDITAISALSGGAISSDGGSPVTARGIVWSVSHNPTLSDSVSEEGTGIGSFTSDLTPLKYSTTYYVRAYATNSIGTTYGNEVTFNTKAAVPSDGLVGWWPFNGNANDESGNGNDGLLFGSYEFKSIDGSRSNCLKFNFGSYMQFPEFSNVTFTSITYSFWINILDEIPLEYLLFFGMDNAGQNRVVIDFYNGFYMGDNNPSSEIPYAFSNIPNIWRLVSLTYEPGKMIGYVNGIKVGEAISTINSIAKNNGAVNWHIWFDSNTSRGNYIYDDIAIYNRALTAEEIQNIYNGTGF